MDSRTDSTSDGTTHDVVDGPPGRGSRWARRGGYSAMTLLLVAAGTGLLGPRQASTRASGGGYDLSVEYPQVTRAGQPAPLDIAVKATEGFGKTVQLRLCRGFFTDVDFQSWYPSPSAETSDGSWIVYEFDPPPTEDTLEISLDGRTAPGQFGSTDSCEVSVLTEDSPVATVRFTGWRLP